MQDCAGKNSMRGKKILIGSSMNSESKSMNNINTLPKRLKSKKEPRKISRAGELSKRDEA